LSRYEQGTVADLPPDERGRPDVSREPTFLTRGKLGFKQTIREASDYRVLARTPYGLKPLIVFTIIGAVSAFDGRVFTVGLPEIVQQEPNLELFKMLQTLSIVGFFVTLAYFGIAWYADRGKRVPLVGIGAILSGVFSLVTARSYTLWTIGASRGGDAVGDTVLSTPAQSLTADYYPVEMRGKAIAFSGVVSRSVGLIATLAVPALIIAKGWRFAFLITGPMMILAGILAFVFLKEPVRGYMERKALGYDEDAALEPEEPVTFAEAWRTIWAIRTLRRLFIASIPAGMGERLFGLFFGVFLLQKYGLGLWERGLIGFAIGLVTLPFGFIAGGMIDVLIKRRPQRVLVLTGVLAVISSFALVGIAAAPPLWVLIAASILFGAAGALLGPAQGVLFLQILPAHMRTMGLAVLVIAGLPIAIFNFFIIGQVATLGLQAGMFAATPLILLGALIQLSAAGLFERDTRAAIASQQAGLEFRKARESGRGKLLICRDIDVEYDGVQVLFGVDFDVDEGDIIALLGTNGAGKSTLLKAISGVQEASSGAIVYNGREITHMPPHEIAPRGVILMPGGKGVFPGLTVKDNLALGGWMSKGKEGAERLEEVYRIFPILKERGSEKAGLLSGGEQQMLSLAQAFLGNPKLLMIDELSLGLSPAVVQQLIEIVRAIHRQGTTIILVEQSVNVALTVAERAIFMEKGEVRFVGRTQDLLTRPDILRAVYVKGTGALSESSGRGGVKSEREMREYELSNARPILSVKEMSKSFGGISAVNDLSFDLREGEILGLIGPNGAGKTTAFDLISGYQIPDRGTVVFDGTDITRLGPDERAQLRLIRRFQDARLFPSLTVYENILVSLDRKLDVRSIPLTALQVPQARQAEKRVRLRADRLIELLDLGAFRDKFVKELSTGLRRISDLACVLASEPKVLLLDEPSTGIAQAEAEMLAPLLRRVRFETGCSILIIEHDMPLISSISDELIALDQGTFVRRGTPEEILNDERVIQSYLGTSEEAINRSGVLT